MDVIVVDALATYRLTRLMVGDHLTEKLRTRIVIDAFTRAGLEVPDGNTAAERVGAAERLGVPFVPKPARLVTCPHCFGFWVACGVVVARRVAPRLWDPIAHALAFSAVTGIVSENV